MKKNIFAVILAVVFLCPTSFGQKRGTSNIKAGYSIGTSNTIVDVVSDLGVAIFTLGTIHYDNMTGMGALYVSYEYAVIDRLMIGGSVVYESNKEDMFVNNSPIGNVSHDHITVGLEINYHYISSSAFQMYSGIGAGYTSQSDKYNGSVLGIENGSSSYFNFQINALGFRFGSSFGVFAEFGFGYKGIVNAGLSYQF